MRHSITFGGVNSADYGIYIGGEGTFNAPERDVEMISIPGRDGAFALDKGRFENIEVKYTVINQEPDLATFSANLEDFRNAICSQRGYQRLEDTFHPDEYRMAVFADKFEVKPIEYNTASKFDIVFDCKPQRYLTDGETAVSVDDGDTLTNPTLFEAHPLLEAEGYGLITMNGYDISIANALMGEVVVGNETYDGGGNPIVQTLDANLYNAGDYLTIQPFNTRVRYRKKSGVSNVVLGTRTNCTASISGDYITVTLYPDPYSFYSDSDKTFTIDGYVAVSYMKSGVQVLDETLDVTVDIQYDATDKTLAYTNTRISTDGWAVMPGRNVAAEVIADSSIGILGNPTYLDCEIGEAYKIENGSFVSLNKYIDLGSKLPELSPGNNEIEYDNTITDLSIIPRWWKV